MAEIEHRITEINVFYNGTTNKTNTSKKAQKQDNQNAKKKLRVSGITHANGANPMQMKSPPANELINVSSSISPER